MMIGLSGCVTTASNTLIVECGTLTKISPELQNQLASELKSVDPNSAISLIIQQYGSDRDIIRACLRARGNGNQY